METLERYDIGLACIETALRNKLRLVPDGNEIDIKPPTGDYDREQAAFIFRTLQAKRVEVIAITSDPEGVRTALCEAQQALSDINNQCNLLLDRVARMEKAYRAVFPGITACINGAQGCPEDAVVLCTTCCKIEQGDQK